MSGGGNNEAPKKCGLPEFLIFTLALVAGSACSILSKTMMELKGVGITGEIEVFQKPMFQTFGMFIGMMFGLIMHYITLKCKIPIPGYELYQKKTQSNDETGANSNGINEKSRLLNGIKDKNENGDEIPEFPLWMYFFLAIPAIFDVGATALCMMGLRYIDVSIYQLLRGSGIIFVALMKQHVLKVHLYGFQWVGVFWNVISVFLVGGTAILNENNEDVDATVSSSSTAGSAFYGVLFVMVGAVIQAMQYVFEEKVMTMDIPSPPLLLIGMEGLWGTIICIVLVYPISYYVPGDDHGSFEDPFNTISMFMNNSNIQYAFIIYFFAIFFYNLFAVLVTYMLNSVWHAILDNFRPITIWIADLFIFYIITSSGDFGEAWTKYSWVQVAGMIVLLYGTAIYNAPNAGSVKLQGEWYSYGLDFTKDYETIESEKLDAELDAEWDAKMKDFKNNRKSSNSFYGEHSPHVSVHTQALRGLASNT